jgi:molecular chaperone HscA
MFIEIAETKRIDRHIVGIDFGTTNSIVASVYEEKVKILAEAPSIVSVFSDARLLIGTKENHSVVIASIKRLLGKTEKDYESIKNYFNHNIETVSTQQGLKLKIYDHLFSPIEIASAILSHLKVLAEEKAGRIIDGAVITVPAYFDNNAKKGVLMAAKACGINVLRVIAEPTAAAYAYGLQNSASGQYMVFDLGGGTFDVSILKMQEGVFRVLGVGGDSMLGGDDIDLILLRHIQDLSKDQLSNFSRHEEWRYIAKKAKEELSNKERVLIDLPDSTAIEITRQELTDLILHIVQKTISITKDLVFSQGSISLDGILLVGGSTKMPVFETALKNAFPGIPILKDLDPERIVAMGAALQAHNLVHKNKDLLIDVTPLSLGIELMGGLVEVIIPRNSLIPTYATKRFTTYADGQTSMQFNVVQGERDLAKDCISLAKFELKGIPQLRAGQPQIDVLFALDANGVLSVTSTELSTNACQEVIVNASYGMSEDTVVSILEDAMQHLDQDFHQRTLLELRNKSNDLIRSIYKVATKDAIDKSHKEVNLNILSLSKALTQGDSIEIQKLLERLEKSSTPLFAKALESSIKHHIVGKKISTEE